MLSVNARKIFFVDKVLLHNDRSLNSPRVLIAHDLALCLAIASLLVEEFASLSNEELQYVIVRLDVLNFIVNS